MFLKKITVSLLLSVSLLANPTKADLEPQIISSPKEYISLFASQYVAVELELLKVAKCESNFKPDAIHYNDGGKGKHSFGVFQYQKLTFLAFSKLFGEKLDYYSYHDQI